MDAIKIAVLGIVIVLFSLVVRPKEPVIGFYLSLAGSVLVFACIMARVSLVMETVHAFLEILGEGSNYLILLIKAVGITMLTEFSATICRENGLLSLSDLIRVFGKFSVLLLGIPVLTGLIEMILSFSL